MCKPQGSQSYQCVTHQGVTHHTGQSKPFLKIFRYAFKGTVSHNKCRILYYFKELQGAYFYIFLHNNFCLTPQSVAHRAVIYFVLNSSYLTIIEPDCKNILTCQPGAQVGLIGEKNQRLKILLHCPFKRTMSQDFSFPFYFMNQTYLGH